MTELAFLLLKVVPLWNAARKHHSHFTLDYTPAPLELDEHPMVENSVITVYMFDVGSAVAPGNFQAYNHKEFCKHG